jgi:hypothetical protein
MRCCGGGDRVGLGAARQGEAWRGKARFGQYGLRPVAGIRCLERTGDGPWQGEAGHGLARPGSARRGRAGAVTKRLRLVVGYTKGAIRRRGVETVDPADHLAQASRPLDGISSKEKLVKKANG